MAGLLDIAPAVDTVDVRGAAIEVFGVSAKGFTVLLGRFPELRMMMAGREVEVDRLMEMGGDAVAAIIAAGIGHPGDKDQEAAASRLGVDIQADFLAAIIRLTFPNGLGPFMEKLTALGGTLGGEASPKGPATK